MMKERDKILYNSTFDMWVLETGGINDGDKYWHEGEVLFVGGFLPLEDQINNLLELILINGNQQKYFKDILRRLTT